MTNGPRVRRAMLLGLIVGLPILFLRFVNDPFNVPKLALLIVGVTVVLAIRIAEILQGAPWEGLRRLLVPAAAIAVPITLAWLFSPYRGWALLGYYGRFGGLLPYLVVIVAGILVADAFADDIRPVAWAFIAAGAVAGAYAVLQWLGMDPFDWQTAGERTRDAAISTLGNPNFTGGFLAITLPLAIALAVTERKRRSWAYTSLVLIALGWLIARSQGALVAGISGCAIVAGLLLSPRWKPARLLGAVVAAAGVAVVVGAVVATIVNPEVSLPNTVHYRGNWWRAAVDMAMQSPLFGSGPNTFAFRGVYYRTVEDALSVQFNFADDPHSVFFAMVANAGVLGAAGYLVVAGWAIGKARALVIVGPLAWGFAGTATAYFIQSLVSIDEVSLRFSLWVTVGSIAAIAAAPSQPGKASRSAKTSRSATTSTKRKRPPPREPLKAVPALVLVGLAVLAVGWWSVRFLVADARAQSGQFHFVRNEPEEAIEQLDAALALRDDHRYRYTYGFYLGEMAAARGEEGGPYIERAKSVLAFSRRFPDLTARLTLARALKASATTTEALEEALAVYRSALGIDTLNPLLRAETAQVLLDLARPAEAEEVLRPAIELEAPFADVWATYAFSLLDQGDEGQARDALARALLLDPDNDLARQVREELGV